MHINRALMDVLACPVPAQPAIVSPRAWAVPCRIMGLGKDKAWMDILPEVIKNYGQAVQHGHRQIFQALPRLLTLWTGFGEEMAREQVGKVWWPSHQFAARSLSELEPAAGHLVAVAAPAYHQLDCTLQQHLSLLSGWTASQHGNKTGRLELLLRCAAIWPCIGHGNVLLTYWDPCNLQAQNQLQEWKKAFAVIQQHMGTFLNKLPPYVWLTVLSQLTSRVCHSNMDVATVNNKILLRAALAYPQQVISAQVVAS